MLRPAARVLEQSCDDPLQINGRHPAPKLVATVEVDVLPGNRRYLGELRYPGQVACGPPLLQHPRHDCRVVEDHAVRQQPAALAPELLFLLRPVAQLSEVRVGDRPPELMVVLAPVQCPLHVLP